MKRMWIIGAGGVAALGLAAFAALWLSPGLQDRVLNRMIESVVGTNTAVLDPDALHIVFCGTGSPLPDPDRASACIGVYAGDYFFLIDSGPGGAGNLTAMQMPMAGLGGVFYTHLHSDHIGDLPDIALNSWAAGRSDPLTLYGPAGIEHVAAGYAEAFKLDNIWRIAHHGTDFFAVEGAKFNPVIIEVPDRDATVTVFEAGDLKVTTFLGTHFPVTPAFGYRIDYKDRSVVFSGDTSRDENVARVGKGADVMVHEALAAHMVNTIGQVLGRIGDRREKIMGDIPDYHATPVEAAEIANLAGAELLVYSHIVPRLPNALSERMFLRGVSDIRPNGVMLGYDGLYLELPVGSKKIIQHDLR